jgi:predicted DNA-binding transcriptional regulator YafY
LRTGSVLDVGDDERVLDTSARLLRLLSLLQSRPDWSGVELAERLRVTTRTVRRDVDRLRQLGYPVDAHPGVGGGYRMGIGAVLPPLLLDDDEATAVALALGVTAGGAVAGIEEPALAALTKLDRLLPPRLRQRLAALRAATESMEHPAGEVDASTLVMLAQACAGQERVRLGYRDRDGRESERRVDPYRLVCTGRRWYFVAFDVDRSDWRTFRVDRVRVVELTGHRIRIEDPPDARELVSRATAVAPYRFTASIVIDAPVEQVSRRVPRTVGITEPHGATQSLLMTGSDDLDAIAGHLVALGWEFEVLDPPELRERVAGIGQSLVARHGPDR